MNIMYMYSTSTLPFEGRIFAVGATLLQAGGLTPV